MDPRGPGYVLHNFETSRSGKIIGGMLEAAKGHAWLCETGPGGLRGIRGTVNSGCHQLPPAVSMTASKSRSEGRIEDASRLNLPGGHVVRKFELVCIRINEYFRQIGRLRCYLLRVETPLTYHSL